MRTRGPWPRDVDRPCLRHGPVHVYPDLPCTCAAGALEPFVGALFWTVLLASLGFAGVVGLVLCG